MLEVDEDSRLGREMLKGGARYRAGLVPNDDAIAQMYERAIERLKAAGLRQYEISNFARPDSTLGTICAIGSGGRISAWGWMHRPC